ncbi:hypothetical protein ABTX34_30030 [Streptomyces sp. NPDC096538]|uniref:hypothetical protein n=1 Tax=Streptomyces sp. NPDC096538 TaxID=3155427 RepID=UPI0033233B94
MDRVAGGIRRAGVPAPVWALGVMLKPHHETALLRVTTVCAAVMSDPLDALPLYIITKAVRAS